MSKEYQTRKFWYKSLENKTSPYWHRVPLKPRGQWQMESPVSAHLPPLRQVLPLHSPVDVTHHKLECCRCSFLHFYTYKYSVHNIWKSQSILTILPLNYFRYHLKVITNFSHIHRMIFTGCKWNASITHYIDSPSHPPSESSQGNTYRPCAYPYCTLAGMLYSTLSWGGYIHCFTPMVLDYCTWSWFSLK